jgi:hypothetical protein
VRRRPKEAAPAAGHPAAAEVVALLAAEFGFDDLTAAIVTDTLTSMDGAVPGHLELIVDDPRSARWRLKADHTRPPWGLRLGYHGTGSADTDPPAAQERQERLNAALSAI